MSDGKNDIGLNSQDQRTSRQQQRRHTHASDTQIFVFKGTKVRRNEAGADKDDDKIY
jgi:hypothetical protein